MMELLGTIILSMVAFALAITVLRALWWGIQVLMAALFEQVSNAGRWFDKLLIFASVFKGRPALAVFRTIQARPKDLPGSPQQAEGAVD